MPFYFWGHLLNIPIYFGPNGLLHTFKDRTKRYNNICHLFRWHILFAVYLRIYPVQFRIVLVCFTRVFSFLLCRSFCGLLWSFVAVGRLFCLLGSSKSGQVVFVGCILFHGWLHYNGLFTSCLWHGINGADT